jgi:hypothetical protein
MVLATAVCSRSSLLRARHSALWKQFRSYSSLMSCARRCVLGCGAAPGAVAEWPDSGRLTSGGLSERSSIATPLSAHPGSGCGVSNACDGRGIDGLGLDMMAQPNSAQPLNPTTDKATSHEHVACRIPALAAAIRTGPHPHSTSQLRPDYRAGYVVGRSVRTWPSSFPQVESNWPHGSSAAAVLGGKGQLSFRTNIIALLVEIYDL